MAQTYGLSPSRIPFEMKDPRGFADLPARPPSTMREARPTLRAAFRARGLRSTISKTTSGARHPALIVVGDEDERCIEPSLFLKQTLPAAGLVMMPKTGHVVNLEEPDLFNKALGDFLARVEAGRWPPRDPRTSRRPSVHSGGGMSIGGMFAASMRQRNLSLQF